MPDQNNLTLILNQAAAGNKKSLDRLLPLIYDELYRLAQSKRRKEGAAITLNTTAMVHEAYLKLVDQKNVDWQSRSHFFAIAATMMRRIIIDYARARNAQKRGAEQTVITLNDQQMAISVPADSILQVDEALTRLAQTGERRAKIIEYWFFVGLNHQEIADLLNISTATVRREWRLARAWLARFMKEDG